MRCLLIVYPYVILFGEFGFLLFISTIFAKARNARMSFPSLVTVLTFIVIACMIFILVLTKIFIFHNKNDQ